MATNAHTTVPNSSEAEQARRDTPEAAGAHPVHDVVDYNLLFDCVHCGLCLESCPTYVVTRAEMDSPRGRIYLMKALAEGKLELDSDAVRHLDLCLDCRGCETACPSGTHYGRLIEKARVYVNRNHKRSLAERVRDRVISGIFPYPERLRALLAPVAFAERIGMRPLMRHLTPPAMRGWLDLLPPVADKKSDSQSDSLEGIQSEPAAASDNSGSVAVHHGCVAQVLCASENRNSEGMLAAAGFHVVQLNRTVCCGALDLHTGNLERTLEFARANVRAIKASGAQSVISAASGCAAAIAQYGELLKDDRELAADAAEVSAKVTDLSSLMLSRNVTFTREFPATVTYHDSCHLAHALGVREAPRKILRAIPGVRLIEMEESDLCCGSAGSYNLTEPKLSHQLAERKADNILATGADYVVLGNPGCELQIAAELRRRGSRIRVIHLADFLALAARANR